MQNYNSSFLGIGFPFPLQMQIQTQQSNQTTTVMPMTGIDKIRQSIYVILMTRKGERLHNPDFGSKIHEYIFELPSQTYAALLCSEAVNAICKWEHRVENVTATIDTAEINKGRVFVKIDYNIRSINRPDNIVFPFYLDEGQW